MTRSSSYLQEAPWEAKQESVHLALEFISSIAKAAEKTGELEEAKKNISPLHRDLMVTFAQVDLPSRYPGCEMQHIC
jgi:hypothetical protein